MIEDDLETETCIDLRFINPTSVIVERLYSQAKYVFTDIRMSMSPKHFEISFLLKVNTQYWTPDIIDRVVQRVDAEDEN